MPSTSSSPPFHLIATDLDGTLLNAAHEITPEAKAVFQQVVKENPYSVSIALASGRSYPDLKVQLELLDVPDYAGFIISCNGARVHRLVREPNGSSRLEEIYAANMDSDDVRYLLTLLPKDLSGTIVNIFQDDKWFCSQEWKEELRYFQQSGFRYTLFSVPDRLKAYESWIAHGKQGKDPLAGVTKIMLPSNDRDHMAKMFEQIKAERPHLLTSFTSPQGMEFNAAGVCKASGVAALLPYIYEQWKRHSGASGNQSPWTLQDCVAFGDADNDVEMVGQVGKGFIMGNGSAYLRKQLPQIEIIGRNTEGAVEAKVREIFLSQR